MLLAPLFNATLLMGSAQNKVSIQSWYFPGSYLRIDGSGLVAFNGDGAGIINCQNSVGPYETLNLQSQATNTFTIGSIQFPSVFLRMDGSNVLPGASYPDGAPTVNAQYTAGPYEQFRLVLNTDNTYSFASAYFPGRYLRMANPGIQGGASGAGTVNIQNGIGPYEKFVITAL